MRQSDILTFAFKLLAESDKAIGVTTRIHPEDRDTDVELWLPKSQIEYDEEVMKGGIIDVQLPRWLADEKGLEE